MSEVIPPVTEAHFRLLKVFGRNPKTKTMKKKEQDQLWLMMCQSAGVPMVEREVTIHVWKDFVKGESKHSSIVINGDIDPNLTTLGVAFKGKISSAHTTKTKSLVGRVIQIWARSFSSRTDFLNAAQELCTQVASRVFK